MYLQKLAADAMVVGLDSALIFEAFGIGLERAFPIRGLFMNDESRKFGWPKVSRKMRALLEQHSGLNENQKF